MKAVEEHSSTNQNDDPFGARVVVVGSNLEPFDKFMQRAAGGDQPAA